MASDPGAAQPGPARSLCEERCGLMPAVKPGCRLRPSSGPFQWSKADESQTVVKRQRLKVVGLLALQT